MADKLVKFAVPLLVALCGALYSFINETNTRLAVLEYRVSYTMGPAPWDTKP